ncbi:MAG: hypothetical protein K6B28_13670 [Lachnospiraceae bacterium]|nr:hypothetical protein [Lachnospiraceae bacterium]
MDDRDNREFQNPWFKKSVFISDGRIRWFEIYRNSKIHGLKEVFLSQMEKFGGLRYTGIPKSMV